MAKKKVKSDLAAFQAAARARGLTYAQAQTEETAAMIKMEMRKNVAKTKAHIVKEKLEKEAKDASD